MTQVPCKTATTAVTQATTGRRKASWTPDEVSDIRKRTRDRAKTLKALVPDNPVAVKSAQLESTLREWEATTADLVNLKPRETYKMQAWLSKKLGLNQKVLGLSDELSTSASVKLSVGEAKRVAENTVENIAKYKKVGMLRDIRSELDDIAKTHSLSKREADELFVDLVEVGAIPRSQLAYGDTEAVRLFQQRRYEKFLDRLETIGLSDTEVEQLLELSMKHASVYDDVLYAAKAFGVDVDPINNLGYFTRIATEDANFKLGKLSQADGGLFPGVVGETSYARSRSTYLFIPEDYELLNKYSGLKYTQEQWDELLDEPLKLVETLDAHFTGKQLDDLVDAGVLSKVPMSSREVFDYMVKQYKLPYTNMSELFVTDPMEVLQNYSKSLGRAAGDSAMFMKLSTEGKQSGWVVTELEYQSNRELYKDFVNLGEAFGSHPAVGRFFKDEGGYVHPVVHDMMKAYVSLSTDAGQLGHLAQMYQHFNRFVTTQGMLTQGGLPWLGVPYVAKQVLGNSVMLLAGGGNPARVIPVSHDLSTIMKFGLEALDDTKPFLKDGDKYLTKRGWWDKYLKLVKVDLVSQGIGEQVTQKGFKAGVRDVLRLDKGVRNTVEYFKQTGDVLGTGAYVVKGMKDTQDKLLSVFSRAASYTDAVFKASLVQSRMLGYGAKDVLGTEVKGTLKDSLRHADNYFVDYTNIGELQSTFGKWVKPFATWALYSTPMVLRHAMRNPSQFVSYLRLMSFLNSELNHKDITQAGLGQYDLDHMPGGAVYDPFTKKAYVLYPGNFDPFSDSTSYLVKMGNNFGDALRGKDDKQKPYNFGDFVQELLLGDRGDDVQPLAKLALKVAKDAAIQDRYGRDTVRLFGMDVPKSVAWATDLFPLINTLSRQSGARGQVLDYAGREVTPAKGAYGILPPPTGKATPAERDRYFTQQKLGWFEHIRAAVGLKVRTIDLLDNNQYTFEQLMKTQSDVRSALKRKEQDILSVGRQPTQQELTELDQLRSTYVQLQVDGMRVASWMRQQGKSVGEKKVVEDALQMMRKKGIPVRSIPVPSEGESFITEQTQERDKFLKQVIK
ncbi:MAG: hypothetical protein J0L70_03075 [Leptolyngbya sp. UWPOB_LEPTO1]|uniref:hypothetical protein n=1 Tax=Leptolyngbya sp. UWPOB_LEPTO1 TaxID=2815653 RepID=UPI001ACF6B3E|nr:hypothetical protein [Leptolyngbya sp. UWPOB_LEPTO1]MBN8559485.1 hypothetical protein [Leptolyngbya sp. UWPOB_LEPTO1]